MIESLTDAVGRTPLLRLGAIEAEVPGVELWAKCEFFNPGSSVKDRAALRMVRDALADGRLKPGMTLIDSTSGNTGIAYAWIGAAFEHLDIETPLRQQCRQQRPDQARANDGDAWARVRGHAYRPRHACAASA